MSLWLGPGSSRARPLQGRRCRAGDCKWPLGRRPEGEFWKVQPGTFICPQASLVYS